MDLRELRTFVAVAELGTVSRAAEQLHVTQPALSRQIANLEGELGIKLFDRTGRRLLLTSEGAQMLQHCRALLSHSHAVREQADGLKRGEAGMLRVSSSPHLIEGLFPSSCATTPSVTRTCRSGWSRRSARRSSRCWNEARSISRRPWRGR